MQDTMVQIYHFDTVVNLANKNIIFQIQLLQSKQHILDIGIKKKPKDLAQQNSTEKQHKCWQRQSYVAS